MSENPAKDPFDGDLETARMRLRNIAEDACKVLDVKLLNTLAYHIATYMDHKAKSLAIRDRMMLEIHAEQQRRRR